VKRKFRQLISLARPANDLYSASTNDLLTIFCFLDFQEIKESPKKTQKPVVDSLEIEQVAQSESTYTCNLILEAEKKMPWLG